MKIAVTGAAGFLGSHLVEVAAAAGHHVVALVRRHHDPGTMHALGASEVVAVELGTTGGEDGDAPAELVYALRDVDAVLHAAARVRWGSSAEFHRDCVTATSEVLDALRRAGGGRLVHVSTTAVFGDRAVEDGPVPEDAPYGRRLSRWDRYARAKIAAEVRALQTRGDGVTVSVVRPGWVFGARDRTLPALVARLRGGVFPLVGLGTNRVAVVSAPTVARCCLAAAQAKGTGAYTLACEWEIGQRDYLAAVARAAGVAPRFVPVPFRAFYTAGFAAELVSRLVPGGEGPAFSRSAAVLLGRDAVYVTDGAKAELGFGPSGTLDEAMVAAVGS